jgi:hypothetical protein
MQRNSHCSIYNINIKKGMFGDSRRPAKKRLNSTCPRVSSSPPPSPQEKPSTTYPKRLPSRPPHHQCSDPGADSLVNPHLRINCTDLTEDSCPGRISDHVLSPSRTRFSKPSCYDVKTPSEPVPWFFNMMWFHIIFCTENE